MVVEDIKTKKVKAKGGKGALAFNAFQVGKEHLYDLLSRVLGLRLHKCESQTTAKLRKKFGLHKTKSGNPKERSARIVLTVGSWRPAFRAPANRQNNDCTMSRKFACTAASCIACKWNPAPAGASCANP